MPPKKDEAQSWADLLLAVQTFGRVPIRSRDPQRTFEDKLRRKIDKAMQTGVLNQERYRLLTAVVEEDDVAIGVGSAGFGLCSFSIE